MRFIITSKNEYQGTSTSDIPNPLKVTEIATELIITRLYLIDLLNSGIVNSTDTVVCIEDRMCLYTRIFDNVISYDNFRVMDTSDDEIVDLLSPELFNKLAAGKVENRLIPYLPFYRNWERDKELIRRVDWSNVSEYPVHKPFIALVIRKRGAWTEKNMSDKFWTDLIGRIDNVNVLVFGKETEKFCTKVNTYYVKDYRDWCSIVSHPNCMHVASTMTGGVYPLLIFGNPEAKMTIIDNTGLMKLHGQDPSFYHSCINFSKIPIKFIDRIPTTEEFYESITESL